MSTFTLVVKISPLTASAIKLSELLVPKTTPCSCEVRVTTHPYVPLSLEELKGENINCHEWTVPFTLGACLRSLIRPLTGENAVLFLYHVLLTITCEFVTPPIRVASHLRVTLLPAYRPVPGYRNVTFTAGGGTA